MESSFTRHSPSTPAQLMLGVLILGTTLAFAQTRFPDHEGAAAGGYVHTSSGKNNLVSKGLEVWRESSSLSATPLFSDDFNNGILDPNKWHSGTNAGNQSAVVNNALQLRSQSSAYESGWVVTRNAYPARNTTVAVKVVQPNNDGDLGLSPTYNLSSIYGIYNEANFYRFYTYRNTSSGAYLLYVESKKNGVLNGFDVTGNLVINGVVYLRLRCDDSKIHFEASLDGVTWTDTYNETFAVPGYTLDTPFYYELAGYKTWANGALVVDDFSITSQSTDTQPPQISGVSAQNITGTGAQIVWQTNEPGDSQVEYGLTTSYGSSSPLNSTLVTSHAVVLSSLQTNTTYHYRVKSKDGPGNLAVSNDFIFQTSTPPSEKIVLNDPLNGNTLGTRTGGSFVDNGGWQVAGQDNMIVYDLGRYIENGSLEVDIRNFDPRIQNSMERHHFLAMFRNPWGNHHPAEDLETVWDLHAGTNYAGGIKVLSLTYQENESITELRTPTWDVTATYHVKVIWQGNQLQYYRDDILYATHTHSALMQLRFIFVGRDFTVSSDLITNYRNNQYPAMVGPIYSNLVVKRFTSATDVTPPLVSNITPTALYANAARISWNTGEAATCRVEYGVSTSYGNSTPVLGPPATTHETTLAGLASNQTYHFRVIAQDAEGNTTVTTEYTFTTSVAVNYLFLPTADTFVEADGIYGPTRSYANFGLMHVLLSNGRECYLRFDVSGVSGSIGNAVLRLHGRQSGGGGTVHVLGSGWNESQVTWRTKPTIPGPTVGNLPEVTAGQWSELSVDSALNGNATYNFALTSSSSHVASLDSRESPSYQPELVITTSDQPSVRVNSPNGGENWIVGTVQNITWNSTGTLPNVKLEFSVDNGANSTTIIASTANDGSEAWTVPNNASNQCLVRILDAADGNPADVSDAVFAIVTSPPPTLTLTSPTGGEWWIAGSSHPITWTSSGSIANVTLDFSSDGGTSWSTIVASTPNIGSYNWLVPNTVSKTCLIRVANASGGSPPDVSDGLFVVTLDALINFTPSPNNPVLRPGSPGSWDENIRERGWFMYENGTYHVWYGGWQGDYNYSVPRLVKLGYAYSTDGVNWTKYSGSPIYDQNWIEDVVVVKDGSIYNMYAEDEYTGDGDGAFIDLYTSTDKINWIRSGTVIAPTGNGWESHDVGTPTAWKEAGTWYMLYEGIGNAIAGQVGLAISLDGKNWTRSANNPVLTNPLGANLDIAIDTIIKVGGVYHAYGHYDTGGHNWVAGLFISTDLISWMAYPGNPLPYNSPVIVDNGTNYFMYSLIAGSNALAPYNLSTSTHSTTSPTLTLTAPNGGESWTIGSTQNITWRSTGTLPNVKLEFLVDTGANWTTIIASTANDGSESWTIPNNVLNQCLVRVSDAVDGNPADMSDGVFAIIAPPAPTITTFTPTGGPVGTIVTITGTNFTGATSVTFNGMNATSFTVDSDVQIRATVPTGSTTGKISVTTPGGTAASGNDFTVTPSSTITLNPTDDAYVRSDQSGSNFGTAATLRMRQSSPTINSYLKFVVSGLTGAVQSAKLRLKVTVASSSGGSVYSVSNNYNGTSTPWIESGLRYNNAPGISGNPLSTVGNVTVGQVVEFEVTAAITGNATFSFGLKNTSSTTVQYSSKEGANKPELVIQIAPPPTISSFSPTSGPVGTQVIITGNNFTVATQVAFNGVAASVYTVNSITQITATVPTGAATGKITVTTASGTATSADNFTVTIPPPTISSFTPTSGPVGTQVTITGSDFSDATQVAFNGAAASSFTVDSNTQIHATVPPGATTGKITVTTPSGSDTSSANFTVTTTPLNLALNKPATASSTNGSNTANLAVDGNTSTYWRSNSLNSITILWLRIDLRTAQTIDRMVIRWSSSYYARNYQIQISDNNTNWTTVHTDNAGNGGIDNFTFASVSARYVRLYMTRNNSSSERVTELEIYAPTSGTLAKSRKEENENIDSLPKNLELQQNYPNPFNPMTAISYWLPSEMHVTLKVYNLAGQEVETLVDGDHEAGKYSVIFDAAELPSGIYFTLLKAGTETRVRRIVFMK